jgi:glutamate N-acetyltransferase / amino-acid N-acetyltransferase
MLKGITFSGVASGAKGSTADLGLVYFDEPARVASLYTRNQVKAAHILYNKGRREKSVRALLVNSGCANACTGQQGVDDLRRLAKALAQELNIGREEILFASTGVIGKRLEAETMIKAFPELKRGLGENNIGSFARAIMTTDTYPKIVQGQLPGEPSCGIMGVAKGAGMINPLFATMLSFLFSDCYLPSQELRKLLPTMGRETFERISVDGDTSTNDTVMVFVKGSGEEPVEERVFKDEMTRLMRELALLIVRDGEGATKVIHIMVNGAKREESAERIARRIAASPLVKTAFFGCDPNWGRIICAVGDAGVSIDPAKIEIQIQGQTLARNGAEVSFPEERLKVLMDRKEVDLVVNLNEGSSSFDLFTTDLTYDYVKINASYRT